MMPVGGPGRIRCGWIEAGFADWVAGLRCSFFIFVQLYFIRGLTLGAVKG